MAIDKDTLLRWAQEAARKAVEYLEMRATGAARAEMLKAVELIEQVHKSAA